MANDGLAPLSDAPSLEGMDYDERVETMVTWFLENFEDPVNETPYNSREGGYLYIHGGPFEAQDFIPYAFPDASEDEHQAAIDQLDADGPDYAPNGSRVLYPDDDYDEEEYLNLRRPLGIRLDQLAGQLDTVRSHVEAILALQAEDEKKPAGIGHNGPPPDEDVLSLADVLASIEEVKAELAKPDREVTANVEVVQRAEGRFRQLFSWVGGVLAAGVGFAVTATAEGFFSKVGEKAFEYVERHQAEIIATTQSAAETLASWADAVMSII
ncbi:hypothetical protein [Novosphingobium sp. TCA1]|jgi:hypothetical protein|uniref:hypothetical protein n=1 Tax=Novosphingobium sp. TCA1 TaxID=2682474 RepID=UPI001307367B|nr:hypothetical protein [Novosphingobium sp. TCA1]GFE72391.1 hypothetical protein NTCA1_00400 [Novosphingobium sp. TCA1]